MSRAARLRSEQGRARGSRHHGHRLRRHGHRRGGAFVVWRLLRGGQGPIASHLVRGRSNQAQVVALLAALARRPALAQLRQRADGAPHRGAQRFGALAFGRFDQALKLAHAAELAPALLDQSARVALAQLDQRADDLAAQQQRRVVGIDVRAVLGLGHDRVDHARAPGSRRRSSSARRRCPARAPRRGGRSPPRLRARSPSTPRAPASGCGRPRPAPAPARCRLRR